jgi:hypothetical protein
MSSQQTDENKQLEKGFWKNLDAKASAHLSKLSEMTGAVLKMKAKCAKLLLEFNQVFNPEYLQELLTDHETDKDSDFIKRLLEEVEEINEQPKPTASQSGQATTN